MSPPSPLKWCPRYPVDGLFFDIVMSAAPGCCCASCLRGMQAEGVDPEDDAALHAYTLRAERRFMARISGEVWAARPGLPIYFNARLRLAGDPEQGNRPEGSYYTHWELESLPTGGWGYTHFSLYNRFFQTLDKPILGMTAAFHRSWADFGTVKSQAALDYECFRALGRRCRLLDRRSAASARYQQPRDLQAHRPDLRLGRCERTLVPGSATTGGDRPAALSRDRQRHPLNRAGKRGGCPPHAAGTRCPGRGARCRIGLLGLQGDRGPRPRASGRRPGGQTADLPRRRRCPAAVPRIPACVPMAPASRSTT